jgi:hypothetical protein
VADDPNPSTPIADAFSSRINVLRVVRSPLSFFVLALLIIEAFLLIAGATFDLPLSVRIGILIGGVILFILVILCVYRLVVKYPTHLVFSETSHVATQAMRIYGDNVNPLTWLGLESIRGTPPPTPPAGQATLPSKEGS